jgi:hypothetical protein
MSRISQKNTKTTNKEINFMGGNSYKLSPLETLKIIACSSIFAEPSYYRETSIRNSYNSYDMTPYSLFKSEEKTTDQLFISAVEIALDFDFKKVLDFAVELRQEYGMRLNPSVIFVLAINHKNRIKFNEENPGYLSEIGKKIIYIPSDVTNMFDFYILTNGSKNNMPSCLKRVFAKNLEKFSRYHIAKYKSKSLIDIVRVSHASSEVINELMKTGTVKVEENEQTWERLRSSGKSWKEVLEIINIPHFALLRNLRGIFSSEDISVEDMKKILNKLESGVEKGKLFPFNYYSAYQAISKESKLNFVSEIKISLENCMDIAMKNFPKLKGKTVCLSDNSGSAHGAFTSEYGSVKVSDIANLSSVMTSYNSEEGIVGCFGDRLEEHNISKQKRIFEQHKALKTNVGQSTENGIWLFLDKAIKNKEHIDNLFIYSDQQAGHGGLYGSNENHYKEYKTKGRYIDVLKLISVYRKQVNPKLNVFSIQVAGYSNSVIPENIYRGAILTGWTGKEVVFADKLIRLWNEKEGILS